LTNAARYTETAGHIGIAAHRDGENVVIEVSDDGIGIEGEALSDIFELFVQGPNRSSTEGGLGLGLVVVKQLTELHGGTVAVASEGAGRGAKFTVRLPVLPAGTMVSAACAVSVLAPPTDRPQSVLLVDDNEDALELLSAFVERAGHQVVVAHDGPGALAALDRFRPSVAVIDISMPVMDGYELAARIQEHPGGKPPYLVALTGYGQANDRERSRTAGFNGHLVKPVDPAHLLRVIAGAPAHRAVD
jgi:CheY-like chemotaxis protein